MDIFVGGFPCTPQRGDSMGSFVKVCFDEVWRAGVAWTVFGGESCLSTLPNSVVAPRYSFCNPKRFKRNCFTEPAAVPFFEMRSFSAYGAFPGSMPLSARSVAGSLQFQVDSMSRPDDLGGVKLD